MTDTLPAPPAPTEGATPPALPSRKRRWPWIAGIIGVLLIAGAGLAYAVSSPGGSSATTSSAPTPSSAVVVPAPSHLGATGGAFRVTLRWKAGAGEPSATGYMIYRDGSLVQSVHGTTWTDQDVLPGTTYQYRVDAVGAPDVTRGSATVTAKTTMPPASSARLAGTFDVRLTLSNSSGVHGLHEKATAGWRFKPTCSQDPCDVKWADNHRKDLAATMTQQGGTYEGSVQVRGVLSCSGADSLSTVHVTIHLTKADVVGKEWRATAFEGTETVYTAAQLGCVSSNVAYAVSGTLAR